MRSLIYCALMLSGSVGFLSEKAESAGPREKEWWETTLVYQIWPRGFQDSDGDGEGDLKGITSRLDYVKDLGVETIWLNPIYPSPLVDSGYDVSNYTDIHPRFGTIEDFDELIRQAHDRELKVILDIVPNHSSDQHEWFKYSVQGIEPYKDYYVWANGTIDDNGNKYPPNNWVSTHSDEKGSAWTWHDGKQQWFYHKFHPSQPDLNLRNEKVVQELMDIFKFWLEKGVDGFRISSVAYFFEDEDLRDEPELDNPVYTSGLSDNAALLYAFRTYISDWVKANNAMSKLLIAESYDDTNKLMSYYGNGTHEGIQPFNFHFITHINNNSDADYIRRVLKEWLDLLPENASTNWVLSNHDHSRAASRIGLNRVDGLHMLTLLLPGQAYTYYGDEIAMLDGKLSWNDTIDTMGCSRTEDTYEKYSRDPARTPMQWNSDVSAGFSTNEMTYLPVHSNYANRNVEDQQNQNRSNIRTYRALTSLRKEPVFTHGDYEFGSLNDDRVFVLKRSLANEPVYIVLLNLGLRQERVNLTSLYPNLKNAVEIVIASSNAIHVTDFVPSDKLTLTANAALVLKGETEEDNTTESVTESEPTTTGDETEGTTASNEESTTTTSADLISSAETEISPTDATDSTDGEISSTGATGATGAPDSEATTSAETGPEATTAVPPPAEEPGSATEDPPSGEQPGNAATDDPTSDEQPGNAPDESDGENSSLIVAPMLSLVVSTTFAVIAFFSRF